MTRYKTRPGVVLTSICGKQILVATKAARESCPYVTEINETSAFLWEQLRDGADIDALMDAVDQEYEVEDHALARNAVLSFIDQMVELNYLLPTEDQGDKE